MHTGIANLPLHYGSCPKWLFAKMTKLARAIGEVIVYEFGPEEFIKRISDPFFFQSLGGVLGFDWHSSGVTTTVCGALKEALKGTERYLGIFICGGKGGTSRKTPQEIASFGEKFSLNQSIQSLIYASKMSAKVDNTALQDGYKLYQHNFFFTANGLWAVVQQGMNIETRYARRYHWLSSQVEDFVCEPHAAICCDRKGRVLNLVARESKPARIISSELAKQNPEKTIKEIKKIKTLQLPAHHAIFFEDLNPQSLQKILLKTYEYQPQNFEQLLQIEGVGPKTIRALALTAELIYASPLSYRDPVKFSFAHGGKDGYPYPVDRRQYEQSINILNQAVNEAKIGQEEKLTALRRLGQWKLI